MTKYSQLNYNLYTIQIVLWSLTYIFGIMISLWLLAIYKHERYISRIGAIEVKPQSAINARIDSWTSLPFVDIAIVDAQQNPEGCPDSHPDEIIFEVWPGTQNFCECLGSQESADVKVPKYTLTNSAKCPQAQCNMIEGRHPIVQNIVNGAIYCGKRGGASFSETVRPELSNGEAISCPVGYQVCN